MAEGIDLNEEKAVNEGGEELEPDDPEAIAAREKERSGGDTSANPSELAQGAGGGAVGPSSIEGASAGNP